MGPKSVISSQEGSPDTSVEPRSPPIGSEVVVVSHISAQAEWRSAEKFRISRPRPTQMVRGLS